MKAVVRFDMDSNARKFNTFESALDYIEARMNKCREDDPELALQWERGGRHFPYTRAQLLAAYSESGEIILQLACGSGDDLIVGEIANIISEEKDAKDSAESRAEIEDLGQQLADSYKSEIGIGNKKFKPKKP